MKNPFQELQNRRKAEESDRRRQQEATRLAVEREEQLHQERIRVADQYNEMVTKVLRLLREAVYPNDQMEHYEGEPIWKLGHSYTPIDVDCRYGRNWARSISVSLVFNEHAQPTHFECDRPGFFYKKTLFGERRTSFGPIQCGLTEAELVDALKKLHP